MANKNVDEHLDDPAITGMSREDTDVLRELFGYLIREINGGEQDNPLQSFDDWFSGLTRGQQSLVKAWVEAKLPQIRTASQPASGVPRLELPGDPALQNEYWDAIHERVMHVPDGPTPA